MKASIDRSGCIGCGVCADICEEVFQMADDGEIETVKYETLQRRVKNKV
jgi:ferredoxin